MKILLPVILLAAIRASATPIEEARRAIKEHDYAKAVPLLEAGAARGEPEAQRRLCTLYGYGYGVPLDWRRALKLCRLADAAGDAIAADTVMSCTYFGRGVEASTTTAARLFPRVNALLKKCAEAGDADCMQRLQINYNSWNQEFADASQSVYWGEKLIAARLAAAQRGGPIEYYEMGNALRYAPSALNDGAGARAWFKKAADAGYAPAAHSLGDMIFDGQGGPKDEAAALELYRRAGDGGYGVGYAYLGFKARDKGDKAAAFEWLSKAAETEAWVAHYVAAMLAAGDPGIKKDPGEAVRWAYRAAKSGDESAMDFLAGAYGSGEGVPKDAAEAVKWIVLASRNGSYSARTKMSKLDQDFTAAQRAEGRKRADAFEFVAYAPSKPMRAAQPATAAAPPVPKAEPPAPPAVARLPERQGDFALVVGIEKYRALPAADYAESDAAAVRERLIGLGFPERNIVSLIGADATRSKMQAYLDEWLPRNATKDGRVFFYFSGHGSPDAKTGQAYLVPADGDPAFLKSTAYPLKNIYAALDALPSRRVVAAIDSCFSGAGGRSVLAKGMRPLVSTVDLSARDGSGRLVVLTAAAGDQTTGGIDSEGHGAFTYYLLKGLEGAARDDSGRITAKTLNEFLSPRVSDNARRQNREQTPMLIGDPSTVLFELPKR
jgi:TPR repeat protein